MNRNTSGEAHMLILSCPTCHKNHSYAVEEFVGRFFVCKSCRLMNWLPLPPNPAFGAEAASDLHGDRAGVRPFR
jgi:hypothetical protein